jgi:hypothetical protein
LMHVPDEGDVERMIRHEQVMSRRLSESTWQIHADYQWVNALTLVIGACVDFVH